MQVSSCWLHPLANVSLSDHFLAVIVMKEREVVGSPRFAWALRCRKTAGNIYIYIGSRWCCWPLCPGWLRLGQCSEFLLRPPGEKSVLSCPVCEVATDTVQTPDSWSSVGLNISWPSCLVSPPPLPILYLSFVLLPQDLALWCNWSNWLLGNKGLQTPALSTIPPAPARCVAGLCQILGILLPYCPPLGSEGLHGGALLPSGQVKDMSQSLVH